MRNDFRMLGGESSCFVIVPELELLVLLTALPLYGPLLSLEDVVLAVHVALRLNNAPELFGVFKRRLLTAFSRAISASIWACSK